MTCSVQKEEPKKRKKEAPAVVEAAEVRYSPLDQYLKRDIFAPTMSLALIYVAKQTSHSDSMRGRHSALLLRPLRSGHACRSQSDPGKGRAQCIAGDPRSSLKCLRYSQR